MSFKPEGHEKFSVSNYMKFEEGANKFRVLREPITGYVYWEDANGEVVPRGKLGGEGAKPIRMRPNGDFSNEQISAMKMFAAMVVYNYNAGKVQILDITQMKIMNALDALLDSPSWGDVVDYDIVVTKTKTGPLPMDVEYSTMPEPKAELSEEVLKAYEDTDINLEALYDGEDPFETKEEVNVDEISKAIDGANSKE